MLHSLPEVIRTPLSFIVVLGVLVAIHEYGHYFAARLCGFHVEAFSIGFGRAIAQWTDRHGTQWQIGWLPLGGFVRLHGHARPEDMTPEERAALRPGQGFHDRSLGERAIVTVAGPVANFLLAIVLFTALFMAIGKPVATAMIGDVQSGMPAATAGLRAGDRVLSIDGAPVASFSDIQRIVLAHPGQALQLHIARAGADLTMPVTPQDHLAPNGTHIGMLGIRSGPAEYRPVGPATALAAGFVQTWDVVASIGQGLWQVITGQRSAAELGGVLRIAQMSGQAASLGFASLVSLVAVLSVNLGLLNLLPIPVLDGGHLLMYGLEAVRGRPLPARAHEVGVRVGLGLILTLVVFAAVNDLRGFGLFRWVAHLVG